MDSLDFLSEPSSQLKLFHWKPKGVCISNGASTFSLQLKMLVYTINLLE